MAKLTAHEHAIKAVQKNITSLKARIDRLKVELAAAEAVLHAMLKAAQEAEKPA